MMGTLPNENLPHAPGDGTFWVDTDIPDERLLRPDFKLSWTENRSWHSALFKRFKKEGHTLSPNCPESLTQSIGAKEFYAVANIPVFKNMKLRYKEEQRHPAFREVEITMERREERKANVHPCPCSFECN
jgi:hypothetical protein